MPRMMQDLEEFLDPFMDLPIRGKSYRVAAPDGVVGLRCQAIVEIALKAKAGEDVTAEEVASLKLDDGQEREFNRMLLGDVLDEMLTDDLPITYINRAAKTVFVWTVQDEDEAAKVWAGTAPGEADRPVPQDRKAPAKKTAKRASSPSSSTRRQTSG